MIECTCGQCGETMQVPGSLAGKGEKCPTCGLLVRVPDGSRHRKKTQDESKSKNSAGYIGILAIAIIAIVGLLVSDLIHIENADGLFIIVLAFIAVVVVGLIPGAIARNKRRSKDIRRLGLVGLVIWPCWLVALIWAFIDTEAVKGELNND